MDRLSLATFPFRTRQAAASSGRPAYLFEDYELVLTGRDDGWAKKLKDGTFMSRIIRKSDPDTFLPLNVRARCSCRSSARFKSTRSCDCWQYFCVTLMERKKGDGPRKQAKVPYARILGCVHVYIDVYKQDKFTKTLKI